MPTINVPGIGNIVLVDREQLRFKSHGRVFSTPRGLRSVMAQIPPVPATWDFSKGEAIKYPILGNNRYGDCYYAAILHYVQTMTGQFGSEATFSEQAVIARYLQLSGGDNGLGDGDVFPEWKNGLLGPNGPHKILDELTVDVHDQTAVDLAGWAFCGNLWTCAIPSNWINSASPGAVWDTSNGDVKGGHAMHWTGKRQGNYDVRTWGISPPVEVTYRGMLSADSELPVVFSLEMFDPTTGLSHIGATYDMHATLWKNMGGKDLPPSPFPPPPQPIDWDDIWPTRP